MKIRRIAGLFLSFALVFSLFGCGSTKPAEGWQEQYDLGVRYLSEGRYEEAIIAFTAAIEIDPKQADAYVGAAKAYLGLGDTDQALAMIEAGREACGSQKKFDKLETEIYELINEAIAAEEARLAAEAQAEAEALAAEEAIAGDFVHRDGYISYNKLSQQEQQWVNDCAQAAIAGDSDTLLSLTHSLTMDEYVDFYTIWENYKVRFSACLDDEIQGFQIELRPENGTGYAVFSDIINDRTEGWTIERVQTAAAPCVNWQWSGTMECTERQWQYGSQMESDGSHIRRITGALRDNLRQGTFTCFWTTTVPGFIEEDQFTTTETYRDGIGDDGDRLVSILVNGWIPQTVSELIW